MLPQGHKYVILNRYDLQRLADLREEEARLLLDNGYYSGAYYLLGYAVECALKACIARQAAEFDFPDSVRVRDSYNHDFRILVVTAGLREEFQEEAKANPVFFNDWEIAIKWNATSRYQEFTEENARSLFTAVTNGNSGILPWIRRRW